MIFRCGLPRHSGARVHRAAELGYHVLISAGSLWRNGRLRHPSAGLFRCRSVALDSAGFVAMKLHGGYRWSVAEYVAIAAAHPWAWWSQMDLCCEPEIAGDAATVQARIEGTVRLLRECREEAERVGAPMPMPILQGWHPADYLRCMRLFDEALGGEWPTLVGVGSVCRRRLGGVDGLWAVLRELHRALPRHVRLHLFGVKGDAIPDLQEMARVESTDSSAWDIRARNQTIAERKTYMAETGCDIREATRAIPCTVARRGQEMEAWMRQHSAERARKML